MSNRVGASAMVTMTIEVDAFSRWGSSCSIEQIERQASSEVISAVTKFLHEKRIGVRIIGKPVVKTIITKEL